MYKGLDADIVEFQNEEARAAMDALVLAEAEEIRRDNRRLEWAQRVAAYTAKELQKRASLMMRIAKVAPQVVGAESAEEAKSVVIKVPDRHIILTKEKITVGSYVLVGNSVWLIKDRLKGDPAWRSCRFRAELIISSCQFINGEIENA